jgi:hypothetical protein
MYGGIGNSLLAGCVMKWPWLIPVAMIGAGGLVYDSCFGPAPVTPVVVVAPAPVVAVAPAPVVTQPAPFVQVTPEPPKAIDPPPPLKKKPKG